MHNLIDVNSYLLDSFSSVLAPKLLVLKRSGVKEGGIFVAGRLEAERVFLVAIVKVGGVHW